MEQRPFKILGIQQIAVSGLDKGRLRSLWVDLLGLELLGLEVRPCGRHDIGLEATLLELDTLLLELLLRGGAGDAADPAGHARGVGAAHSGSLCRGQRAAFFAE